MQATLLVKCSGCERLIAHVGMDTAGIPEELQTKLYRIVLTHRQDCWYYCEELYESNPAIKEEENVQNSSP